MLDQEILEIISSFASGCIDKKNFDNLIDYIENGGKLPEDKLGELQNLVSLLSLTVEKKKAPSHLKSKVAKKLLSVQDEIKARIRADKIVSFKDVELHDSLVAEAKKDVITEIAKNEKVKSEQKMKKLKDDDTAEYDNYYRENEKSGSAVSKISIIIALLAILLSILFYFTLTAEISSVETELNKIKNDIKNSKAVINQTSLYLQQNKMLNEIIEAKDISLVKFLGTTDFPAGYAKLFLNTVNNDAIFTAQNLPLLNKNEIFQIWIVTKKNSFPVKSFIPNKNEKYIYIEKLPYIPAKEIMNYKVTLEKINNDDLPEGKIVLLGKNG